MAVQFSESAMHFLRGLARHNNREWFNDRKAVYERELKTPLLVLIAEINQAFLAFAPDHVRPPQKAMLRIYRDIRFSADKSPYKDHVSAWWSREGIAKTSGAGFYLSIRPAGVVIAAGVYKPDKTQLLAIRRHLVEHGLELLSLLESKKMKAAFEHFEGSRLTRPPKGFVDAGLTQDALNLIMCRQWGVTVTLPPELALSSTLLREIVNRFRIAEPVVALLNAPLVRRERKRLF